MACMRRWEDFKQKDLLEHYKSIRYATNHQGNAHEAFRLLKSKKRREEGSTTTYRMPLVVGGQEGSSEKRPSPRHQLAVPTIDDILLGDAEQFQNHPGNLQMYKTIQMYMKFFVTQREKSKGKLVILTKAIYRDIVRGGARFLKQIAEDDHHGWVEATKMEGLRKIGQAIREGPRNKK